MSRPTLEVADIVRRTGNSFWQQRQSHLAWPHRKVLDAIVRCRTAALGGHRDQWVRCGHQAISFNSCRNRHCPKCQGNARAKWLAARSAELLPVSYFHVVFTLPHSLSALVLQNKRVLYDLLYRTSAATMLELARDPKHLGADIGFLGVLHTWGQNLEHHPHVHYIVPAGGLALDGSRWIDSSPRFFLPVKGLSRRFRRKFCAGLRELFEQDRLQFHGSLQQLASPDAFNQLLGELSRKDWVVYAKPPFGGRQEKAYDRFRPRVPAPLPAACSARRSGSYPALRTLRQPQTKCHARTLPRSARRNGMRRYSRAAQPALSNMLRHHARCRTANPRPDLLPSEPAPGPAKEVRG